jgi:hypothetical protein
MIFIFRAKFSGKKLTRTFHCLNICHAAKAFMLRYPDARDAIETTISRLPEKKRGLWAMPPLLT